MRLQLLLCFFLHLWFSGAHNLHHAFLLLARLRYVIAFLLLRLPRLLLDVVINRIERILWDRLLLCLVQLKDAALVFGLDHLALGGWVVLLWLHFAERRRWFELMLLRFEEVQARFLFLFLFLLWLFFFDLLSLFTLLELLSAERWELRCVLAIVLHPVETLELFSRHPSRCKSHRFVIVHFESLLFFLDRLVGLLSRSRRTHNAVHLVVCLSLMVVIRHLII